MTKMKALWFYGSTLKMLRLVRFLHKNSIVAYEIFYKTAYVKILDVFFCLNYFSRKLLLKWNQYLSSVSYFLGGISETRHLAWDLHINDIVAYKIFYKNAYVKIFVSLLFFEKMALET